jgi:hypothetical protein
MDSPRVANVTMQLEQLNLGAHTAALAPAADEIVVTAAGVPKGARRTVFALFLLPHTRTRTLARALSLHCAEQVEKISKKIVNQKKILKIF